jgi:hypothetical protein
MSLRDIHKGGRLSWRDLRDVARSRDAQQPATSFDAAGSVSRMAGGVGTVPADDNWFLAKVTAAVTGGYTFAEVWVDTAGAVTAFTGGRVNGTNDPAVSTTGATLAANDIVLARRSRGAVGRMWELFPVAPGGVVASECVSGCGTILGLLDSWALSCEVVCNTGEFDSADFAADYDGTTLAQAQFRNTAAGTWKLQYWDPDTSAWVDWLFDYGAAAAVPILTFDTDGTPVLTINGKVMYLRCLGADATFTGGVRNGFVGAGTQPTVPCDPNDFTLRLSCECEWIDGWRGDGYYCVDQGDGCEALLLTEAAGDACDTGLSICSGPYASLELAEAECPAGVTVACCTDPIPQTLNWTLSGTSGTCVGGTASGTVTYNAGTQKWETVAFGYPLGECEENASYDFFCNAGTWSFTDTPTVTCPESGPFSVSFTKTINGGTYTITFTA